MNNYFSLIPGELIEVMIPYLDNISLNSFISTYNYKHLLNWITIFSRHFGKDKTIDLKLINYDLYDTFLSIQKLKNIVSHPFSRESNMRIYNSKELNLVGYGIDVIPPEMGKLRS